MQKISIDPQKQIGYIQPELHSQFIEFLGSCIYNGIWVGEASEIPNIRGIRKDVVTALKELAPPVVRWPGGCYADTYHWRNGVGSRDKRPVTYNENFLTYELDSNQFGTHEFMDFCDMIGARPWLNVNLMSGSVAEMREWMEYCNRKDCTSLAKERAQNGSEKPFDVEYWGIGNEMWGGGGTATAQTYAAEYRKYASAFPSFADWEGKNPIQMKRIACGPDGNKPKERIEWTKAFFESIAEFRQPPLDAYDLHFYNWNMDDQETDECSFDEQGWYRVIQSCLELEEVILEQRKLMDEGLTAYPKAEGFFPAPEAKCDLIVGEWGNWHRAAFQNRPALYQQCTMRDAITSALTLDIFHRNCNIVKMACVAQTVNVLNSLILTNGSQLLKTPNYDVFQMYQVHRGAQALTVTSNAEDSHIFAFASFKENIISVNLINSHMTQPQQVMLSFPANVQSIGCQLLTGKPDACNSFENPNRIRMKAGEPAAKASEGYCCTLPAASVSVYQFQLQ